jgi:hypothetical protein
LGAGEVGEAIGDDGVHRFAVLEQADDVMHTNARADDNGGSRTDAGGLRDVTVCDFGRHGCFLRFNVVKGKSESGDLETG